MYLDIHLKDFKGPIPFIYIVWLYNLRLDFWEPCSCLGSAGFSCVFWMRLMINVTLSVHFGFLFSSVKRSSAKGETTNKNNLWRKKIRSSKSHSPSVPKTTAWEPSYTAEVFSFPLSLCCQPWLSYSAQGCWRAQGVCVLNEHAWPCLLCWLWCRLPHVR